MSNPHWYASPGIGLIFSQANLSIDGMQLEMLDHWQSDIFVAFENVMLLFS